MKKPGSKLEAILLHITVGKKEKKQVSAPSGSITAPVADDTKKHFSGYTRFITYYEDMPVGTVKCI